MIINLLARIQANFGTWLLSVAARLCMLPFVEIVHKDIKKGEMMMILSSHPFLADLKNLPGTPVPQEYRESRRETPASRWGSS